MRRDIVAVIPALDCAQSIAGVVEGSRAVVGTVVVVDDGSRDATVEEAVEAGAQVEVLAENRGKGFALRRGLELALRWEPQAVVFLDGDGQHDPRDLPQLLAAWDAGQGDLVIGCRMGRPEAIPPQRYWTNYIGSSVLSWMTGREIRDSQSGYRLASAELLRRMDLRSDGYAIESEMLLKAVRLGARVAHVPVSTLYRERGCSHYRPIVDTLRISLAAIYFKVFDDA